jgi:hypothetical protein
MGERRVHHEGTKGTKMLPLCIFRVIATGAIILLTGMAVLASHVRAQDRIDPEELRRAASYAAQKWEAAAHPASPWNAHRHLSWEDIGWAWGRGTIDMTTYDLLHMNPDRKDDILAYLNDVLIPAMYRQRSAYICNYTRRYYGHTIFLAYANVYQDPFVDIAYFVGPTRNYLKEHNLILSPLMQRELERGARLSPNDGFLGGSLGTFHVRIPCDNDDDATGKSFRGRT